MARQSSSKDFLELFRKSSKDLISERFYDAMDIDPHDTYHFNGECNDITVGNRKNEIIPICKKYQRFLNKCLNWSDQNSKFDVSLLLSYWLYEKLIEIYGNREADEISWVFSALQGIWAKFFNYPGTNDLYYKKCKPDLDMVNHKDWENRKKLYDYYVDYDYLFSMAQSYRDNCDYYKKIKEMSPVYKSYEEKCPNEGQDCPKFFHKFQKGNHELVLEKLPCHIQMEQAVASAHAKASSSHHPGASERGHGASSDGYGSQGREHVTLDTVSTSQSSDIGTKVSHTVLGAAPVLLTATALYRYTPLGPWIRSFGGGRTNGVGAIDMVPNYMQETGDMFSDNDANYISYQPM